MSSDQNPTVNPPQSPPPRRRWKRWRRWIAVLVLAYLIPVMTGCMGLTFPFDAAINLQSVDRLEAAAIDPERPTLVVLQHGITRTWASLWRLERALSQHGHQVLNFSYPSTLYKLEDHAQRLRDRLEQRLAEWPEDQPAPRLCFVGHSMGGLVIRAYLARPDARHAESCVFVATPHRGAALADARKDGVLFRLFIGKEAGLQLRPSDPIYQRLGPVPCARIGNVVGRSGELSGWNDDIPGDDDGTVGVEEAQLPEQSDVCFLKMGHTRVSCSEASIHQILWFLRHGEFRRQD